MRGPSAETIRRAIAAQAELHHQFFLGLQIRTAVQCGPAVIEGWLYQLFRRQHEEKFLSSFDKLGLSGLPHAVACAQYHVLSNRMGGVRVDYMPESDRKAWVRFRYPRWMFDGAILCGMPVEASRGFLRGWYARNGVSLKNPRLAFVCVSEDMTGQFGLCGYFQEGDRDLSEDERLRFAPDEVPPPFDAAVQPVPPSDQWDAERLAKASRNYALYYVRNGLVTLAEVVGTDQARTLGQETALLTGLQNYPALAAVVDTTEGGPQAAADFIITLLSGMGDTAAKDPDGAGFVTSTDLRIVRGLAGEARDLLLACWLELWGGTVQSHQQLMLLNIKQTADRLHWTIRPR